MLLTAVVLSLISVSTLAISFDQLDHEVEHHCIQHCSIQNRTDGHYDFGCDYECSANQCITGCQLLRKALESSCKNVCNGTSEPLASKELYCVMGCNDAITRYFIQLRLRWGIPPAPALVADSLTATSLRLEWNFSRPAELTYVVQWKYEELVAAGWQYCRYRPWGPQNTVFVDNLQPYTKYRFRIALLLTSNNESHGELHREPIVSAPSVVVSTLPEGVPASPPAIVRAVPIDCSRISVSWEPGPFPHGPLLSYELRITDNQPQRYSALKDIPVEKRFYIFENLEPSRNYTVSISMRNGIGAGPAAQVSVSTPMKSEVQLTEQPILILGARQNVIKQGANMLDEPKYLYNATATIEGITIHVNQHLLFVSDSERYIYRMPLAEFYNDYDVSIILSPAHINFRPLDLSVDWLNNHLYILGEVYHPQQNFWQITRCGLDGEGLTVAIAGLRSRPHHIEVDPYNGFLFWVVYNNSIGGLYSLDLSDISNGIKREIHPELLSSESNLGAFTVDHTNFRILVANQNRNTIISVSLDGKEVIDVRPKVNKARMQKVLSLASANKTFYWTDGNEVLYEEYHPGSDRYYHNSYPSLTDRSCFTIVVSLPSSQPVPIPVNPPTNLQAIFGINIAKIFWQAPHLLGSQGKGAWQNWSYEISIKDMSNNVVTSQTNINTTSHTISALKPDTEYIIKAAAYTNFGKGPWSSEFRGRTLKESKNKKNSTILWSAAQGLLKTDATGENVEILIHRSLMRDHHFTDVAWYKSQLYLVTNTSQAFWYNINTHKQGMLMEDSVGSISVDWIGKKLYWSNPKQQLIIRANLNGTQQEPLPILTLAKELNVDAVHAYLYWSTGHAVECARLNGADRSVYHTAELFSGKQVMGLTLDLEHQMVYWIVRSSEDANLFRAPTLGSNQVVSITEKVSSLQKPNIQGPLSYFNNRLLWLQDDKNAVISDLQGKNLATIKGKRLLGLTMVDVMDSALQIWPDLGNKTAYEIAVIPEMITKTSIKIIGSWKSFNITWQVCQNVNYGTVFYEVKIDTLSKNDSTVITTSTSSIEYGKLVAPYTKLHVTIRAYTYWGTSPPVSVKVYSPPSVPSAPQNLRTYVTYNQQHKEEENITITFRWGAPTNSNGVIQGYKIKCWYKENNERIEVCQNVTTDSGNREFWISNLMEDVYYFQVQAFTEVGEGDLSLETEVDTSNESPLPTLLVATSDSIFIQDIDINQNYSLLNGISTPIEVAYLINENKVFWINEMQELFMYNLEKMRRNKIFDLTGNAVSLTIDWLERSLYYVDRKFNASGSYLYKVDLNLVDKGYSNSTEIFKIPGSILKLEISPFTKKLYWIETNSDSHYQLMEANTDGSNMKPFFPKHAHSKRDVDNDTSDICNCPPNSTVEKVFTIDHSNSKMKPLLIFIDTVTQNIMSTDKDGCHCDVIANNTLVGKSLPLQTLKSDVGTLYWTNSTYGLLYALKKNDANVTTKQQITANDILIYGSHMQPYPPMKCLIPKNPENFTVGLLNKTSTSLILMMPEINVDEDCWNISMATIEYNIHYKPYTFQDSFEREGSNSFSTFRNIVTLDNLKPFSKYIISVEASNYYINLFKNKPFVGPGAVFQTTPGKPSKPKNVSAVVLNPTLIKVKWLPPDELNGETIWYEIHWQMETTTAGIRQKGEQVITRDEHRRLSNFFTAHVNKLSPNQIYSVLVRAYSQTNETYIDSDNIKIKTFSEPSNIALAEKTAYSLHMTWKLSNYIKNYTIQYSPIISNEWLNVSEIYMTKSDNYTVAFAVSELKPKTQYKFRLLLKYLNYSQLYIWPSDTRYTFETLADRPSPPGVPIIQHVKRDVYQVWWEAAKDNGSPIELYLLEALKWKFYRNKRSANRSAWFANSPFIEEQEEEWISLYNGSETSWVIKDLSADFKFIFRVLALNAYGWSDPSEESNEFDLNAAAELAERQDPLLLMLIAICVPVAFCLIVIIVIYFACCKYSCSKNKKMQQIMINDRGPDLELATVRELPRRGNFVQNTNILYGAYPTPDEISMLPHISRDQITLMKFLGSGAFGEVFEGKAKGIDDDEAEIKVAVKTLRKGASEQEKCEFLQEAQLMSHFKHKHILQLLGVCLDNDPQFIIMELMLGGDLLTYLRTSRNLQSNTPSLNLLELLKMCADVARGCQYLEEMHFVHRDLACRNCLVSSSDQETRIVKIGDFGLARDIYKNDYYRKEGEGLLPVRWMAPESLVDGVFTCQSDVWAFGVLLWEIMTLGQQPYPARNNLEVLHYVKRGGRLGKPTDCPEELHSLMLKCWSFEAERRPTFKFCLEELETLLQTVSENPETFSRTSHYIHTVPRPLSDGVSNEVYFGDETRKDSGASWKSGSDEGSVREKTPFLQHDGESAAEPTEIPKYLELLHDADCPVENDGYEIPRSSFRSTKSEIISTQKNPESVRPRSSSVCSAVSDNCVQQSDNTKRDDIIKDLTSLETLLKNGETCTYSNV